MANTIVPSEQYLDIIKNFMNETNQRINEECQFPIIQSRLITIIQQASIKLKTYKTEIEVLTKQLKQAEITNLTTRDIRNDYNHLEKRITQKSDEINILRETIKTLYQDNERISIEKEQILRQVASSKDNYAVVKKKLRKQEEEMNHHKAQLKKITNTTEEKFGNLLKQDQNKQHTIRKLSVEVQRLKSEAKKNEKTINSNHKKIEDYKHYQKEYERSLLEIQSLTYENTIVKNENQSIKENYRNQKNKLIKDNQKYIQQEFLSKEKIQNLNKEITQLRYEYESTHNKIKQYEDQIVVRTQKLKQKSGQIKIYNQQIYKLNKRVQQLSEMFDEVINENKQLSDKYQSSEQKLEELKTFQNYVGRVKGDIELKKSKQIGKLIECLGKLQTHA